MKSFLGREAGGNRVLFSVFLALSPSFSSFLILCGPRNTKKDSTLLLDKVKPLTIFILQSKKLKASYFFLSLKGLSSLMAVLHRNIFLLSSVNRNTSLLVLCRILWQPVSSWTLLTKGEELHSAGYHKTLHDTSMVWEWKQQM